MPLQAAYAAPESRRRREIGSSRLRWNGFGSSTLGWRKIGGSMVEMKDPGGSKLRWRKLGGSRMQSAEHDAAPNGQTHCNPGSRKLIELGGYRLGQREMSGSSSTFRQREYSN